MVTAAIQRRIVHDVPRDGNSSTDFLLVIVDIFKTSGIIPKDGTEGEDEGKN